MRRGLQALAIGAAMAAAGSASAASVERGHRLVAEACGACHAVGREGLSPYPAAPRFRELGWRYPIEDLQEALAEGIVTGHAAMPQFRFDTTDVDDIVAYLKSIQLPPPPQPPASAPAR